MNYLFLVSALAVWFILIPLAILNAGLREKIYKKFLNELYSHQLSSLVFIIVIFTLTFFFLKFIPFSYSLTDTFIIGIIWLVLTILFEFIAGHYIFKNPWGKTNQRL